MSLDGCVAFTCGAMGLSAVCDCGISWSYSLFLGSEYPLYLPYMNHKTGDLETWFTPLDSKWVWAGNAPDQVPYCFRIRSWSNLAITKSDCNYYLTILVCRQRCNRYWNIWSKILVCRPGSNPLCGLGGGALAKYQLFTIWYMQQHGSK